MTDPWGNSPGYPPASGPAGRPFPASGGYPPAGHGGPPPPTYGPGPQHVVGGYGAPPTGYGSPPGVTSGRQIWPLVSVVVAVCGTALAFAPPPAGWVGVAAGVFGVVAAIIGWLRRDRAHERSALPVAAGAGLSVVAIVAAVVMSFVYGSPETVGSAGSSTNAGGQLKVEIGSYDYTMGSHCSSCDEQVAESGLTVTLTNEGSTAEQFALAIGAYEGDSNKQIQADREVVVLAGGATQEVEMFGTIVSRERAEELKGADFRVIGVR